MVEIQQGEVWWAELPEPQGSGPGFRRPVLVVQGNALNRSRIATASCVPMTSNLVWAEAPGNTLLRAEATGLPKDSVAYASQLTSIDRSSLTDRAGQITAKQLASVLHGIDIVLGRQKAS